jgi:hypothetical protein
MNHYFLFVPIELFTTLMHMLIKIVNNCEYTHPKVSHVIKMNFRFMPCSLNGPSCAPCMKPTSNHGFDLLHLTLFLQLLA